MLKLNRSDDLSIKSLKELIKEGRTITITPHIGNRSRSDVLAAQIGITLNVVETNKSQKDILDKPGYIAYDGEFTPVLQKGQNNKLSPYLKVDPKKIPDEIRGRFAENIASIHYRSTQALQDFSADKLFLASDFTLFRYTEIFAYLDFLLKNNFPIFGNDRSNRMDRVVNEVGETSLRKINQINPGEVLNGFFELKRNQIDAVLKDEIATKGGPLLANSMNILITFLNELLDQKQSGVFNKNSEIVDLYTVSGPSMFRYAMKESFSNNMQKAYELLRKGFPDLPENIRLNFIPISYFDFLPSTGEPEYQQLIGDLFDIYMTSKKIRKSISETLDKNEREELINGNIKLNKIMYELRNKILFTERSVLSQYDLIIGGDKIFLPESAEEVTLYEARRCITIAIQKKYEKLENKIFYNSLTNES